jgi:hypothetical protein
MKHTFYAQYTFSTSFAVFEGIEHKGDLFCAISFSRTVDLIFVNFLTVRPTYFTLFTKER